MVYTVLSSKGQEVKEIEDFNQAVADIKEIAAKKDKWLYIDGNQKSVENLQAEDLKTANTVTLTNRLTGG